MDKNLSYREMVRGVLRGHAHLDSASTPGSVIETQVIEDEPNGHYLLMYLGWQGHQRVRGCVIHVDVKQGQIWIQHDGTEYGVANELVDLGVPKEDIVLGFRAPYRRRDTGFGEETAPATSPEAAR